MAKTVSASDAEERLSELVNQVARGGQRVVIESGGRPLAALVSVGDLERLEPSPESAGRPRGLLALAGTWRDIASDEEVASMLEATYAERARDPGRPVDLGG